MALITLQFRVLLDSPSSDVIAPSSDFTSLERKKREEREEGGRNEPGREVSRELEVLTPAGLPGKGTDLASHHTQPASAYV